MFNIAIMAKIHRKLTITAGDIKKRHPRYLTCETDRQYAELANDIYNMMYELRTQERLHQSGALL